MLEFELWWLLVIPLFFGLGWLAARIDMRAVILSARKLPTDYFKGLSALVDGDTAEASRRLTEVARQEPDVLELQVSVGKLYRRRGENDLAIRLHQQLLASSDLPEQHRDLIQLELAEDFQRAGLVDRAEEILLPLSQRAGVADRARSRLLDLFQQERDWARAIQIAGELRNDITHYQRELAQFHCELAQTALIKSDLASAGQEVAAALAANRRCPRAYLLQGDVSLASGDTEGAIAAWQSLEIHQPDYLAHVAERLVDAYEREQRPAEAVKLLRGWLATYPQLDMIDLVYSSVAQLQGDQEGLAFLRDAVHGAPSLAGMAKLIDAQFATLNPAARQDAELARELMLNHARRLRVYRCQHCNFRSKTFFWRCPACGEWESFTPNRSEALAV